MQADMLEREVVVELKMRIDSVCRWALGSAVSSDYFQMMQSF